MNALDYRPQPLRDVASGVAAWLGTLSSLVVSAASWGIITAATSDAIVGLLGLIPGVLAAGITAWAAIRSAIKGEPLVTPMSDPRTDQGEPLVVYINGSRKSVPEDRIPPGS